jgi:hypothetical protein
MQTMCLNEGVLATSIGRDLGKPRGSRSRCSASELQFYPGPPEYEIRMILGPLRRSVHFSDFSLNIYHIANCFK